MILPDDAHRPTNDRVELVAVRGLPDFKPGDDLAAAILDAAELVIGDIVVVAQKVVSKCEGRYVDLRTIDPSSEAMRVADLTQKDPRLVEVILGEAAHVLRAVPGVLIVANRRGHVMANAGIDASNLEPDPAGGERVLLLPDDPDHSARQLRDKLMQATAIDVAVVINDSWGRAWRNGTAGHAVGVSGMLAVWDRRGEPDMNGRAMQVTEIGLADEVAAAASLIMGAGAERQPVVIVRGLARPDGDGAAVDLVRDPARDLFR